MRALFLLLFAAIGIGACSTTPSAETSDPAYHSWERIMDKVIEPTWTRHLKPASEMPVARVDLMAVAANAERAARYLEYAMTLDPHAGVTGFADAASSAVRWLGRIELTANAGDGDAVQELISGGEAQYCDRCHDLLP